MAESCGGFSGIAYRCVESTDLNCFSRRKQACSSTPLLTMMAPLLHLGMVLVGVPYSTQELFTTQGGGSPYGPGHVAGGDNQRQIDQNEAAICRV
jgi:multimeric flavodoxin WrbA